MILIADSGSTKTTWILVGGNKASGTLTTEGLNPYFHNSGSITAIVETKLMPFLGTGQIREVHFYGAGCSTAGNNQMIRDAIRKYLGNAEISVYHDIMGSARALFGDGEGIACILGTGCNSCYFDGTETHAMVDSLGYLFGDEGAGSYLGKLFLGAYLKKELPAGLHDDFNKEYGYTLEYILGSLYNKPFPNRFLASFSLFLSPRREHPFIEGLILRSFRDFFEAHIRKYEGYRLKNIGFVGSIAHCYREILQRVATEEEISITRILASPADGLVEYHIRRCS